MRFDGRSRRLPGARFLSENLARIHDAAGIEDLANLAHKPDLQRIFIAAEILALELSNTMFRADAAAITRHFVQHLRSQSLSMKLEEIARHSPGVRDCSE